MELRIERVDPDESILSFAEANCFESDLLPPLRDRVNPNAAWFAAMRGSDLVGLGAVTYTEDLARVGELCVPKGLRSESIGRAILGRLMDQARSKGKSRIMITGVDIRDVSTRSLLEGMGFRMHRDGVRMEWEPRPIPDLEIPEGYELKTYEEGDEEAWAECINRAYATTPNPTDYTAQRILENWVQTPSFMPDGCFFITFHGRIVGCFMAWREVDEGPTRGRLHWLAVDPDHRRRGIAKYLTARLIRYLQSKGLTSIFLDTGYNLPIAMEMYKEFGFVETPRLFDYVRDLA